MPNSTRLTFFSGIVDSVKVAIADAQLKFPANGSKWCPSEEMGGPYSEPSQPTDIPRNTQIYDEIYQKHELSLKNIVHLSKFHELRWRRPAF